MPEIHETRLRENAWVWTLGGDRVLDSYGANCVGVAGKSGVLLVDPLIAPAHARMVEAALREKTDLPIRFVVLTHHHTDHALGSSWFARQATVVAHENCATAVAAEHPALVASRRRDPALAELFSDAAPARPGMTFDDRVTLDLGETVAEVFHPGHGHTAGDAVVHLPRESLVVCGDLVSNGYHVNFEDASIDGYRASLARLLSVEAETFVPGHGAAGAREIVERAREYFEETRTIVGAEGASTRSESEIAARLIERFPGYLLEILLPETVRRFSRA